MAAPEAKGTCAVCGRNGADVVASDIGPTAYPRCGACIDIGAESIGVICLTLYLQGGPDLAAKTSGDSWWPCGVQTYIDGRLAGWQDIVDVYPDYAARFSPR